MRSNTADRYGIGAQVAGETIDPSLHSIKGVRTAVAKAEIDRRVTPSRVQRRISENHRSSGYLRKEIR